MLTLPWLGGEGDGVMTNELLWNGYSAAWPTNGPGTIGGQFQTIPAWGLPLINTLILLSSGVTLTIAHHALKGGCRGALLLWLGMTVLLGCVFLFLQAEEYIHAYTELNLTLGSGIYGSTFFMLTGFHGMHVLLGTIMLAVMWLRAAKGTSLATATSLSKQPRGTGTSSTWCGWRCSCSYMSFEGGDWGFGIGDS